MPSAGQPRKHAIHAAGRGPQTLAQSAIACLSERSASSAAESKDGRVRPPGGPGSAIEFASAMGASSGPVGLVLGGSFAGLSGTLPSFCTAPHSTEP